MTVFQAFTGVVRATGGDLGKPAIPERFHFADVVCLGAVVLGEEEVRIGLGVHPDPRIGEGQDAKLGFAHHVVREVDTLGDAEFDVEHLPIPLRCSWVGSLLA